jgi:hypothetical protein
VIAARRDLEDLLEEHALVGALGLLEGGDADQLVSAHADRLAAVGLQHHVHPVAGDEAVPFPLEPERAVLQRQADDGQRGVAGAGREGDAADERQRLPRRQAAQLPVVRLGVEELGDRFLGGALRLPRADPLPAAAAGAGGERGRAERGIQCRATHGQILPEGETAPALEIAERRQWRASPPSGLSSALAVNCGTR